MAWNPPDTDTIVTPAKSDSGWQPPAGDEVVAPAKAAVASTEDLSTKFAPADYSPISLDWTKPARNAEELGARNFYGEQLGVQAYDDFLKTHKPPAGDTLEQWHPSLWERFRNSDVGHRIFGPTEIEREDIEAGRRYGPPKGDVGLVPIMMATPGPWMPANESLAGKALLSYFIASNIKDQPEVVSEVHDLLKKGDNKKAYRMMLEDSLNLVMTAGAVHGLHEGIRGKSGKRESGKAETEASEAAPKFTPPDTDPIVKASESTPVETAPVETSQPAPANETPTAPVASADEQPVELAGAVPGAPAKAAVYEASDAARYRELQGRLKGLKDLNLAQPIWQELYALKARYGGKGPDEEATVLTAKVESGKRESGKAETVGGGKGEVGSEKAGTTPVRDAVDLARKTLEKEGKLSVSLIQRRNNIGYKQAKAALETLAANGEISQPDPAGPWVKTSKTPPPTGEAGGEKAAPVAFGEEDLAGKSTKSAKSPGDESPEPRQIVVPAERLDGDLWTGKRGDIDKAYSQPDAKKPGVNAFTHEGKQWTVIGRTHQPFSQTAHAYELISPDNYKGPKAGEVPYSREGDQVTHKGKPYILGPKTDFVSGDRAVESYQKLFRQTYDKGGMFTVGKTYHEVLRDMASHEHWDAAQGKYVPGETVAPNFFKAVEAELAKPDYTKHAEAKPKGLPSPEELVDEVLDKVKKVVAVPEAGGLEVSNPKTEEDTAQNAIAAGKPIDAKFVSDNGFENQLKERGYELKGDRWVKKVKTIPSFGVTGKEIYQKWKQLSESPQQLGGQIIGHAMASGDFTFKEGKIVKLLGKGYRDAAQSEIDDIHDAISKGSFQVERRPTTGGTISIWTRTPKASETIVLHQATGKPLKEFLESDVGKKWQKGMDEYRKRHPLPGERAGAVPGAPEVGGGGRTAAMGGSAPRSAERVAAERAGKIGREAEQKVDKDLAAGAGELGKAADDVVKGGIDTSEPYQATHFLSLRKHFNPTSLGDAAKLTGTILRKMLGQRGTAEVRFDTAVKKFRAAFDKRTTPRDFKYDANKPLPPNWELQRAIDTGDMENLTPMEKQFADVWGKFIGAAVEGVRKIKPEALQDLHEFYFARYWRAEDEPTAVLLSRQHRPWQGNKSFMKARSIGLWEDALKRGLRPRYDNPADAAAVKLAEIEMFRSALEAHNILKDAGIRRFVYIFEKGPEQWVEAPANDPSSKVFGPPTVTIEEAYDEQMRVKTLEMFKSLGIDQKRLANIGGSGRWGYAREGSGGLGLGSGGKKVGEEVATKFGGPDFVFWHEFGHIMDFRYPDLREVLGLSARGVGRHGTDLELRALADLRKARPEYAHKAEEKMANVFDAYLRAPELFKQTAPTVYDNLLRWLEKHPEVKGPLDEIMPSLELGSGETEKFVGGPILLGRWMMPPDAAAVLNNYLSKGFLGSVKSLQGIKRAGGLITNLRLVSAFHGQMVGNDALASGVSLPLYDAMKAVVERNPKLLVRGLKDLPLAPLRPVMALVQGHQMLKALRDPAAKVAPLDRQLAELAMEANLRAGHYNSTDNSARRWSQRMYEAANAMRERAGVMAVAKPGFEALLETPFMVAHHMMRPVMEWFVPRIKYGLSAPMIQRVIADNPGADPWEIRAKLGKVGDAVEDRVGQVTYDNLFQSRSVKDTGQLALQAYGWHMTKERLLFGAASDYFKAGKSMMQGKRPEITFRMTYLPSLVITHAIVGGTIMYMLTGRRPKHMIDYLFPETGLVDQYGRPVRMAIADFLKDYMGEWNAAMHGPKAVIQEWERRLMPVWNELADMYRNKDFWNVRIFSDRKFDEPEYQHLWTNLKEGFNYVGGSSLPFSMKGAQRFGQSLPANPTVEQKAFAMAGPFLGFVPAPIALTQSPAEARAGEIMRDSLPAMTKDQAAHSKLVSDLVHDLRTGKLNDEGQLKARLRAAAPKDQAELTRIQQRVTWTPLQYQIHRLPLLVPGGSDALSVWDLMSDQEKVQTSPVFMDKIQRAYEGGKLDVATTSRLVKVVMPFLKQAMAAAAAAKTPGGKAAPPAGKRYTAFQQ
jgi:hypothetical protein